MNTLTRDQKFAALVIPILLFGVLGVSYAYADFKDLTDDQKDALDEARDLRESGDFDGAKQVLQDAGVTKNMMSQRPHKGEFANLTEEQKDALTEARTLHEQGNDDAAKQVLADAGIDIPPFGNHIGPRGEGNQAVRDAIRNALANKDYDAFVAATENAPFKDMISQESFNTLLEAYELNQSGDHRGAHQLLRDAGLPPVFGAPRHDALSSDTSADDQ
ncbi:hypothetical protein GW943_02385 [Candidatus Parcubacteria bacterium]|uniref:Uncharacterized protein n=1 Tax=Candidatus Kaiserbacteria bacterium CG10_big_fil_rev_8_21_14_0_10_47_16 TaxID=1974608 RepID=A0A2H0UDN8_9BACT|nr:hypothetical protein [Candidatus Parcubacteria bacterium]PIR84512.1 MAG: hypothetical protein COU16_02965 [Candidatus Kaiserbacteria bacterium CG10_big_fil_rev_8_21_14_0_10_47_16]